MEEFENWGDVQLTKEEEASFLEVIRAGEKWQQKQVLKRGMEVRQFFENRIDSEWLTTLEAASYLSLSPNALRIRVHRGAIPVYKFGRQLRFRREDCRALFQRKGAI